MPWSRDYKLTGKDRLANIEDGLDGAVNAGSQTVLPVSNGVDDTTALNLLLAAGGSFVGTRGASYKISAPLVLPSNTTLDMSACTVTLLAGNSKNMVNNSAVASVRRVLDAVTTATSTTMTSATAAFVPADVGKAITIQGAGAAGVPLTTTIAGYTNATTVTLGVAASTSVSGQYAVIGARESNITVIGGLWDRGANGDTGYNGHNLRFRHVDGLIVIRTRHNSSAGKYAINPGDCTRVTVDSPDLTGYSSDGVHLNGPCSFVTVRNVRGTSMHDDLVSLTARDSTGVITDCAGDITDVDVDCAKFLANSAGGFSSVLKIIGGKTTDSSADYAIRRLTAKGLTGPTAGASIVYLGDSAGGIFDDIILSDVRSLGGATLGCVLIHGGTSLDRITLRDLAPDPGDSYAVSVDVSVSRLDVAGVKWTPTVSGGYVVLVGGGTLGKLLVSRAQVTASNGGALVRAGSGATVTTVQLTQNTTDGFAGVVNVAAGGAIGTVNIDDLVATTATFPLGIYAAGTTTLEASNVNASGMTGWLQTTGGTVNIIGVSGMSGDNNTVSGSNITGGYLFGIGLRSTPTYGGTVTPDIIRGEWLQITATNGTAFTINAPTNGPPAGKTATVTLDILNSSGGALGVVTWNGNYQLLGGAFVNPANTKHRWIRFQSTGNGSTWVEVARAAADY